MAVIISLLVLLIGITAGWLYFTYQKIKPSDGITLPTPSPEGRVNFLLIGVDARLGEYASRSDTIIFASVDLDSKEIYFISIPRDSLVDIPGYGQDKINAAHSYGGISLLIDTVSQLLSRPIHYYVEINFEGFAKVIDILGGVDYNVEERMYYPWEDIDLYPGLQHLNGEQALAYVRYRGYPQGDIARVEKQQSFLRAIIEQHFTSENISKIPIILEEIAPYMQTNIPIDKALQLARAMKDLKMADIRLEVVPGDFLNINGVSYWGVDMEALSYLLDSLEGKISPSSDTVTSQEAP